MTRPIQVAEKIAAIGLMVAAQLALTMWLLF